jgi:hypothetical protein
MNFTYALTGWEGLATDACIYKDACANGLHIPEGKYFLADAGYPLCHGLLIPYRSGICYHLAEWGCASVRWVCCCLIGLINAADLSDLQAMQ